MSESSRKRKRKRSSKEEETSKDQQTSDGSKSKHNEKRHSRKHRECTSHVEEESRQIKKAVYKRCAREETGKRQVIQAYVAHSKPKSTSLSIHPDYPQKVESNTVKDKVTSGGKIKERCPSRSQNIKNSDTDGWKEEKDSKYSLDEKAHHMSPPRLKKQQTSPSDVSEERWKHRQYLPKSKDKELHKNRNESKTIKTKEQIQTSLHSKYSIRAKQREIIKETCQESQELLVKEKESRDPKTSTDFTEQFSLSTKAKVSFEFAKSSFSRPKIPSPVLSSFKIPKKVKPELVEVNTSDKCDVPSTSRTATCTTERTVRKIESTGISFSNVPPTTRDVSAEQTSEQMQVAEELQLARFERRLEVDVMQSYGELTCMDIDPPEERATHSLCKQSAQQDVILVLDTNILLSNLDYVKKIQHCGLGALGLPIVLIPWVVLQELDSLKKRKGLTDSVAHLACPAISYIYNSLKRRESHLWGQSMQQAAASNNSLMAENNDDKVLQCCLQYQSLYPGCALILCTNDKNLCSKAVLSGVKALSKLDLEEEVEGSGCTVNHLRSTVLQRLPQIDTPMPLPMPRRSSTPVLSHTQGRLSLCLPEEERKNPTVEEKENIKRCVSEFENCLQEVLSNVLEMEMKATYDELWQEIIYIKPPWNLLDILHCLKRHWRAVFGFIVPRSLLQTVLNLIDFFKQGLLRERSSILVTLQQAKEFVKEFGKRSSHVPRALNEMDDIAHKLTPQPESAVCDVVMNEDDEAKRPPSSHVPHHEVWAMFENIWCKVCEISLEVFKALAFDPHARQSALPEGGPAPLQDAVVCLGQVSSMVSQLLQAFISVLSSSAGLQEVQMLLTTIRSNKMVDINSRLADTDLLSCFLQEDYREKLRVGVNQLTELKDALDHCVQTTGQHLNLNM
ncbi:transcriptional protein SWT1 isoform X2 [Hippocampus comes]|uniref:transcriptional protein SWT1 isoform X2 n=1 Tax=Hippocampus comes TaxID=109280 RepID=UPI00094F2507|nr:PREDICTED: transcriptional protein SWT1 isoform X2 [Hippocampus comes]